MALSQILTALKDPSARLTQHLRLKIGGSRADVDVVEFTHIEAFNTEYALDLTVTVSDFSLDGSDFVGKHATFEVEERVSLSYMKAAHAARITHGLITQWEFLSASHDIATFQLRIEPRVALLDRIKTSRVFREKTLKEIFYELLVDRKLIWPHDINLNFEGLDERYDEVLMYEESVLAFIKRLCLKYGLYYYYTQAESDEKAYRDSLVIDNQAKGYVRSIDVPVMPYSGLSARWHEAVLSIKRKRRLMPGSVTLRERNYRTPQEPLIATIEVDYQDKTLHGSIDRSAEHFHTKAEGAALAEVRRDEIVSRQITLSGTANTIGAFVGVVIKPTNVEMPDAKYGFVIFKATTAGSRSKPVHIEFDATPAHLVWRPEYVPARDWRWMPGSIIATVETADKGSPYADLDEHGRYLLRFHFQAAPGDPGSNSMRVRALTPSASNEGGFHAPLLPGTEVRVGFTNNDIDRPYVIGALFDYARRNHVHGYNGWQSRAVWRSPLLSGKLRFEDYQGKEGVKLATIFQKTSVSMGYLVDNQKKRRGEGVEINSSGHGTFHASKGLFFSADALSNPNAQQLEMTAALESMRSALAETQALLQAAQRANAGLAQVKDQQAQLENAFKDLQKQVILLSAPDGIGATTPQSIHLTSGEHLAVASGGSADVSAGDNFTVAAGKSVSLFAQTSGVKVLARTARWTCRRRVVLCRCSPSRT
ncbi:hypothetical protein CR51_13820 [Caballeronia megalochromosomata]|nr:hypothetical protein CR51_13820 [Caballeronia megalochromosomata]